MAVLRLAKTWLALTGLVNPDSDCAFMPIGDSCSIFLWKNVSQVAMQKIKKELRNLPSTILQWQFWRCLV